MNAFLNDSVLKKWWDGLNTESDRLSVLNEYIHIKIGKKYF
ncbi:MAG: hypothetical protein RIS64_193 [Bacteroidota bacterium]|jgi:hypothetical protein